MNNIKLSIFNKIIELNNFDNKISIKGLSWENFKKLIESNTSSNFELTKYNLSNVKNWDDIIEFFTYMEWHPHIKVITKLEKKPYTELPNEALI